MHEYVLAQNILNKILERAKERGLKQISYARVSVGETLLHDKTELEELFIQVSKGTLAHGINLDINITPLKAVCDDCGKEFDAKIKRFDCSKCGSRNIQIVQGNDLVIEELY